MTTLQDVMKKRNRSSDGMLRSLVQEYVDTLFDDLKDQLVERTMAEIKSLTSKVLKGDKGDRGSQGAPGAKGDKGEPGESVRGEKGDRGDKGEVGPKGDQGPKGNDGSPDTAQQIAAKLNTTKDTVNMSVIKGLVQALQRKGGGSSSGGGMGNVTHEHKGVSSATTSVSTTYKIAGNGFAIWAYYNGQLIARGTDYTVSTDHKTLPLLFTPQDSTVIDLVYIRT